MGWFVKIRKKSTHNKITHKYGHGRSCENGIEMGEHSVCGKIVVQMFAQKELVSLKIFSVQ